MTISTCGNRLADVPTVLTSVPDDGMKQGGIGRQGAREGNMEYPGTQYVSVNR